MRQSVVKASALMRICINLSEVQFQQCSVLWCAFHAQHVATSESLVSPDILSPAEGDCL
jgi:hypothetical protein